MPPPFKWVELGWLVFNLIESGLIDWIGWIGRTFELIEHVELDEIVELEDDKHFVTELVTCV